MPRARLVVRPGGSQARALATTGGTVSHDGSGRMMRGLSGDRIAES